MLRNSPAERDLVARLRAGDETAVADLHSIYSAKIHQLAFRHLKSHEDAEEVTQDVLLRVFRKIDLFRGDAALSSWVYRITFNAAMSRMRRARVYDRIFEEVQSPVEDAGGGQPVVIPDWSSTGDESYLRSQVRTAFKRALARMPSVYRTPVLLRDVRGLSTEEASRALRVNVQTLKSRLHRGRLFLRAQLGEFDGGLSLHRA